jgi:tetratricopeptide (TPR) repeat protein
MMPYGFRHLVSQDGQTWNAPRKFLRDALELEMDKVVGNTVLEDHYHLWYIAKSYADCYGNSQELPFGKIHSDEYARRSIWYYERFLDVSHDWLKSKTAKRKDEMGYYALITMGHAYFFIGDNDKAKEHYLLAEQFQSERNEHLLYLCFFFEKLGKYQEILDTISKMMSAERINPFPRLSFLIESRSYYDTSNFLIEYRENINRKMNEPKINMDSISFDFK